MTDSLTVLPEDSSLVPSAHIRWLITVCNSNSEDMMATNACTWHTFMHIHIKPSKNNKNKSHIAMQRTLMVHEHR